MDCIVHHPFVFLESDPTAGATGGWGLGDNGLYGIDLSRREFSVTSYISNER